MNRIEAGLGVAPGLRAVVRSTVLIVTLGAILVDRGIACPFCSLPNPPLTERLAEAEVAVLASLVATQPATARDAGQTRLSLSEVFHQPAGSLKVGMPVTLVGAHSGRAGDLFLLLGTVNPVEIDWQPPIPLNAASLDYLKKAPPRNRPDRLGYFITYLENANSQVGDDAFAEFALADYGDVRAVRDRLPRDRLRHWLNSPQVDSSRIGLYGLMLGLCGDSSDALLLRNKILETHSEFRLGVDGVMAGYILLTGDAGLDLLDQKILADPAGTLNDRTAYLQALRFLWQYEPDFDRQRVLASLRQFLDRPDLADQVIADLARARDWSIQDRLLKLYASSESAATRRAIVRYTLAASRDIPDTTAPSVPAHVRRARESLEDLERIDPRSVSEARRFLTKPENRMKSGN